MFEGAFASPDPFSRRRQTSSLLEDGGNLVEVPADDVGGLGRFQRSSSDPAVIRLNGSGLFDQPPAPLRGARGERHRAGGTPPPPPPTRFSTQDLLHQPGIQGRLRRAGGKGPVRRG